MAMFGKFRMHDFESVILRLYEPAFNELISSVEAVYPEAPVQLYAYGEVPPKTVMFIDPEASLKHVNANTEGPSTLVVICAGWVMVAMFGKFFEHDSESDIFKLYEPAVNELISSVEAVYPDGPVQLKT